MKQIVIRITEQADGMSKTELEIAGYSVYEVVGHLEVAKRNIMSQIESTENQIIPNIIVPNTIVPNMGADEFVQELIKKLKLDKRGSDHE